MASHSFVIPEGCHSLHPSFTRYETYGTPPPSRLRSGCPWCKARSSVRSAVSCCCLFFFGWEVGEVVKPPNKTIPIKVVSTNGIYRWFKIAIIENYKYKMKWIDNDIFCIRISYLSYCDFIPRNPNWPPLSFWWRTDPYLHPPYNLKQARFGSLLICILRINQILGHDWILKNL